MVCAREKRYGFSSEKNTFILCARRQHIFALTSIVLLVIDFFFTLFPYSLAIFVCVVSFLLSLVCRETDGSICSKSTVNILFEYFKMWFHPASICLCLVHWHQPLTSLCCVCVCFLHAYHQIIMKTTLFVHSVDFIEWWCFLLPLFLLPASGTSPTSNFPQRVSHTALVAYVNTIQSNGWGDL